jgi:hypothetical protein
MMARRDASQVHQEGSIMDWKLELVAVPVSDVDRAKTFNTEKVGFNADQMSSLWEQRRRASSNGRTFPVWFQDARPTGMGRWQAQCAPTFSTDSCLGRFFLSRPMGRSL